MNTPPPTLEQMIDAVRAWADATYPGWLTLTVRLQLPGGGAIKVRLLPRPQYAGERRKG